MNLKGMKPPTAQFFEHALRNAGRPPFVRPCFLARRPRAQQTDSKTFLPEADHLPEVTRSDQ
jgi:hypothetical protein